jgi:hypothetical protein
MKIFWGHDAGPHSDAGSHVNRHFYIKNKQKQVKRKGKPFLFLTLALTKEVRGDSLAGSTNLLPNSHLLFVVAKIQLF